MGGGRGEFRRSGHAFMADKTKYEWADLAIERGDRIAVLEDALERIIESWNWQDPDVMREIAERALGRLAPTSGPAVPGMSRRISRNTTDK